MKQCSKEHAERINTLLRSVHKNFKDYAFKACSAYNITFPQFNLLWELYHYPNITLNELSEKMDLAKSTVSAIVDRLEVQGLVIREIPRENRRTVRLLLSPEFMKNYDLIEIRENFLLKIIEKVKGEDAEKIIYALEAVDSLLAPDIESSRNK